MHHRETFSINPPPPQMHLKQELNKVCDDFMCVCVWGGVVIFYLSIK